MVKQIESLNSVEMQHSSRAGPVKDRGTPLGRCKFHDWQPAACRNGSGELAMLYLFGKVNFICTLTEKYHSQMSISLHYLLCSVNCLKTKSSFPEIDRWSKKLSVFAGHKQHSLHLLILSFLMWNVHQIAGHQLLLKLARLRTSEIVQSAWKTGYLSLKSKINKYI